MRHTVLRLLAIAVIAYAMACGGGDFAGGDSCSIGLIVTPELPARGDVVEVTADVAIDGAVSGIEVIDWSVRYDGDEVPLDVSGVNGDEVLFTAEQAGVYAIAVTGSVGSTPCAGDFRDLNVNEPGAIFQPMRLVVVPRSLSVLPPQRVDFDLPGGADYSLSTVSLEMGALASALVQGPGGEPLAGAYVRATPANAGPELWVERFSQEDGRINLRLLDEAQPVLVVPDADLPALGFSATLPADLPDVITVDQGISVTGTVEDGAGDPVAGARVQITVAGAPSTIGTTNGAGAFSLRARAGSPITVSVTPTEASGLPALEVPEDFLSIDDGATLAIHYDAGLDLRSVSPVLRESDGSTPAAGARVTFVADPIVGAGSIAVDGTPLAATGQLTRTAQANGAGVIPAQLLTATRYQIIVEPGPSAPAAEAVRFAPLDLRTGQGAPANLLLAAPAHLTGVVLDADDAPVPGARVVAAPIELLTRATSAGGADTSAADGSFDLAVAGRGRYQVRIDGAASAGRIVWIEQAPAPGGTTALATTTTTLPRALRLVGSLAASGGNPVAGALVQLQCRGCGPGESDLPVAEAVSDASGNFELFAPDPGVAE